MKHAGLLPILSLVLFSSSGLNAMATSPLPERTGKQLLSPVCVVSGLPEESLQALQRALCEDVANQLRAGGRQVEVLTLNDPRLSQPDRLVVGIRGHVEAVDGAGIVLTLTGQVTGNDRRIPAAAHCALLDPLTPAVSPAIHQGLQKILRENGLL